MVYFCRFCRCFYFICGVIWIVDRFMLLVYMYFGDKESISLAVDFLYPRGDTSILGGRGAWPQSLPLKFLLEP